MASFDDLLNPRSLEDNPFADPFAAPARGSSPDPWSAPSPWGAAPAEPNDGAQPFDEFDGSAAFAERGGDDGEAERTPLAGTRDLAPEPEPAAVDPLDAPSANVPEPDAPAPPRTPSPRPTTTPLSPGFREAAPSPPPTLPAPPPAAESSVIIGAAEEEERARAEAEARGKARSGDASPPTRPASPPSPPPPAAKSPPLASELDEAPPSARMPHRQTPPPPPHVPSTPSTPSASQVIGGGGGFGPLDKAAPFSGLPVTGEGWDDPFSKPYNVPAPAAAEESDDDDDKPLRPRPVERKSTGESVEETTARGVSERKDAPTLFRIRVEDPTKVGDPIRGYTMYTVHTETDAPGFAKRSFSVLRRYSDFLWLAETLAQNNPGVVVPPVPEKAAFGRFDEEFVQARRAALERCVRRIANHEALASDADLKLFLESDTFALDIKHRKAEAGERAGLLSGLGAIAGPRFVETDEWFERQKSHLDTLESQLRGLCKAVELAARQRSELAAQTALFAAALSALAASDVGGSLSHSLGALAAAEERAERLESAQAAEDARTLMAAGEEYVRLIGSVRGAFAARVRVYHAWQAAEQESRRARREHERNRAAGRIAPERVPHALNLVADAERRAHEASTHFAHVSALAKREAGRFERERVADFRAALGALLDGMSARARERIQIREEVQGLLLAKVERVGGPPPAPQGAVM